MEVKKSSQAGNRDKSRLSYFLWHLSRVMLSATFVLLGVVLVAWVERDSLGMRSVVIMLTTIAIVIGYIWLSSLVMRIVPQPLLHTLIGIRMTIVAVALCGLWLLGDCAKPNLGLHTIFGDLLYFMRCTLMGHSL
jgi:lipopolysaccharide export LptBFGC system permease protein LptF